MAAVTTPRISVVMPSYNHGHYISRAIDSVLAQQFQDWELIIVDNHSTDNTREILSTYADPRIHCIEIHNEGIIAASRNLGVEHARGEWVAFLDSDDWWYPEKLKECSNRLSLEVDVLYHDLALQGVRSSIPGRRKIHCWQVRKPVLKDLLVRGNALATSAVLARRDLLLEVAGKITSPAFRAAADYACWLSLARLTDKFLYLPRVLGCYLVHGQGVSRQDMSAPTAAACKPFLPVLSDLDLRAHQSWLRYMSGRYLFSNGRRKEALADLRFALAEGSGEIRLKALLMLCQCLLTKNRKPDEQQT